MEMEWDGAARAWTRAKGVAEFERAAAEGELGVPFEAVTRLYEVGAGGVRGGAAGPREWTGDRRAGGTAGLRAHAGGAAACGAAGEAGPAPTAQQPPRQQTRTRPALPLNHKAAHLKPNSTAPTQQPRRPPPSDPNQTRTKTKPNPNPNPKTPNPQPPNPEQKDPDDLAALPEERHRALARATIASVEADKRMEVYKVRGFGGFDRDWEASRVWGV